MRAASALFGWAVDREWVEHSPATRIKALKGGHLPAWTVQEADAAQAKLPEHLRRVVILARYTGQRRGDLCAMTWGAFDGEMIRVRQQKTGAELVIPCHPELRAELLAWKGALDLPQEGQKVLSLAAARVTDRTILTNASGCRG